MPSARKSLISLENTPYYHVTSRCVRRAFLCGTDPNTGQSFEHRREWIERRLLRLGQTFAIDVCTYAVMHNHYHAVLHIDKAKACQWSDLEVCRRWHQLCKGSALTQRFERGETLSKAEREAVQAVLYEWRLRLSSISWFMKILNEFIAREANREDDCTGKFWESRFKSQALLDDKALAACLAYVDLNPIRANMAQSPETSEYTGVRRRIEARANNPTKQVNALMPFAGNPREPMPKGLPFCLDEYLSLVDWSGRAIHEDKQGAIPSELPPILERLNIESEHWLYMTRHFESKFKRIVGGWYELKRAYRALGYRRTPGLHPCRQLL